MNDRNLPGLTFQAQLAGSISTYTLTFSTEGYSEEEIVEFQRICQEIIDEWEPE